MLCRVLVSVKPLNEWIYYSKWISWIIQCLINNTATFIIVIQHCSQSELLPSTLADIQSSYYPVTECYRATVVMGTGIQLSGDYCRAGYTVQHAH